MIAKFFLLLYFLYFIYIIIYKNMFVLALIYLLKMRKVNFLHKLILCRNLGLPAACTIRSNRTEKCPLKTEKLLRKEGRGSMDFKVSEEGIVLAKWFDNKEVTVGSNHYSVNPTSQVNYLSSFFFLSFFLSSFFNSQVNYLSYFFHSKVLISQ